MSSKYIPTVFILFDSLSFMIIQSVGSKAILIFKNIFFNSVSKHNIILHYMISIYNVMKKHQTKKYDLSGSELLVILEMIV
jgi:hypothetical protein